MNQIAKFAIIEFETNAVNWFDLRLFAFKINIIDLHFESWMANNGSRSHLNPIYHSRWRCKCAAYPIHTTASIPHPTNLPYNSSAIVNGNLSDTADEQSPRSTLTSTQTVNTATDDIAMTVGLLFTYRFFSRSPPALSLSLTLAAL